MKQPSDNEETYPAVCTNTYTVENEIDELSDMEIGTLIATVISNLMNVVC